MTRLIASVLLLLWLLPGWSTMPRLPVLAPGVPVTAMPVALVPTRPGLRRLGPLTYLGGWRLGSADPAFGGWSAMIADGDRLVLLSDGGVWMRLSMAGGRIGQVGFGTLPAGPGQGWQKEDRDSESLTRDAQGRLWVGFEQWNAIWRYAPGFARAEASVRPLAMRRWAANGGPEAMARLPDGRFLVLSESSGWAGQPGRAALLFAGDPTSGAGAMPFSILPPAGYDFSEAAALPDGRVLLLARRFALPFDFAAKLLIVDLGGARRGAVLRPRELADFSGAVIHDNFEALGVTHEGADTILWMASDDNQFVLQRSLLLKFRIDPAQL